MSEEVNFFRSGTVFQAAMSIADWYWPVGQSDHFVGFSFFPDTSQPPGNLVELSVTSYIRSSGPFVGNALGMGYQKDAAGNCVLHFPLTNISPVNAFFSVSVASVPP